MDELDKGQVEELKRVLEGQYGSGFIPEGVLYGKPEKKGLKIFYYTGDPKPDFPTSWRGMHLGTLKDGIFTPSIEGAQLIASKATEGVVEVSGEQAEEYMRGGDLDYPSEELGGCPIIVSEDGDVIGPAKAEPGILTNIIPKSRLTERRGKEEI